MGYPKRKHINNLNKWLDFLRGATQSPAGTGRYRPDIDGLRAVAILAVLGYHYFPKYFPGGFVGVDIFFVISGFLISGIILDDLAENKFSFLNFYARRVRRLFPALALVLAFSLAAGWLVLFAEEFKALGKHMFGGAAFISNILYWRESGYFDAEAATKPLLHLWSLGIEEQFYLAFPFILVWAWKRGFRESLLLILLLSASLAYKAFTYKTVKA
jgi:peptidoglycan/LPS O-acetylase OafA/YrhL